MHDEAGAVRARIRVLVDVTERRQVEEALRSLSTFVQTPGIALFTMSLDGTILSWNQGAELLYGYLAPEIVGRNVGMLADPDDPATLREVEAVTAGAAGGQSVTVFEATRRHRDGREVAVALAVSALHDATGALIGASVVSRDITDRRRLERELRDRELFDPLTSLPNRALLDERLREVLGRAAGGQAQVAMLVCDVDHFNRINDSSGHRVGDAVLREVARRLATTIRSGDTLARFGGDEFVIVAETGLAGAQRIAARVARALREAVVVEGDRFYVTASIGIAVAPPGSQDAQRLLGHADAAMHAAKAAGRACWRVFEDSMASTAADQLALTNDLREAIESHSLVVHYQPQVDLRTGAFVGVEALVRWRHPSRGWIPPGLFVTLAENCGYVPALDGWVLEQVCADVVDLRRHGLWPSRGRVAVNRSAVTLADPGHARAVLATARAAGLPVSCLEIEVTETSLLSDASTVTSGLRALRRAGAGIALDDFGTGYSSLRYLREWPVSGLKIDRAYVANLLHSADDRAIAASVLEMAAALDLRTVAEGVESSDQVALLQQMGCRTGQGYLWSPAVPVRELGEALAARAAAPRRSATSYPYVAAAPPTAAARRRSRRRARRTVSDQMSGGRRNE